MTCCMISDVKSRLFITKAVAIVTSKILNQSCYIIFVSKTVPRKRKQGIEKKGFVRGGLNLQTVRGPF